jgi:hypothetical protein
MLYTNLIFIYNVSFKKEGEFPLQGPKILRKRLIPDEIVDISGDEILHYICRKLIITRWVPIHPRNDISGGVSFAFLDKGYKISKFNGMDGKFAYWYCDIIDAEYDQASDTYTLIDLLLDVKIFPDGKHKVLDIDEFFEAISKKLITKKQAFGTVVKLIRLLGMIYTRRFPPKLISEYKIQHSELINKN